MESKRSKITPRDVTYALNDVEQVAGNLSFFHLTKSAAFMANDATETLLKFVPGWAIAHGLFQIFDGVALISSQENHFYPSPTSKKLKGILQILFGGYLAEGGLEVLTGGLLNNAPGLPLLYFRFAVNAWRELAYAIDDFCRVFSPNELRNSKQNHSQGAGYIVNYVPKGSSKEMWNAAMNVLTKCFACMAWSALAYGNPAGSLFLVASAICCGAKYIVPLVTCGFFKERDEAKPPQAPAAEQSRRFSYSSFEADEY